MPADNGGSGGIPKCPGHFDRFVVLNATYMPMKLEWYTLVEASGTQYSFAPDMEVVPGDADIYAHAEGYYPVKVEIQISVAGVRRPIIKLFADEGYWIGRVDIGRHELEDGMIMPFEFILQEPFEQR